MIDKRNKKTVSLKSEPTNGYFCLYRIQQIWLTCVKDFFSILDFCLWFRLTNFLNLDAKIRFFN